MSMPAWQTGELDEEWVESSPSPPPTLPRQPSTEKLPTTTADSIRLKRGSLRALGHSAPRALPPSRHASRTSDSPRIISGHGEGRVLSEKMENDLNAAGRLPSPPTSGGENDAAGTFLVKDGVDDDRGKHLARKGRDMFGPSALEKMFRPPSPVGEPATPSPAPQQQASSALPAERASASTTPPLPPATHMRKASHPYAPINPSRLSKSVTPSSASTSFSATLPDAPDITDLPSLPQADTSEQEDLSDARTQTSLIVDLDEGNRSSSEELEHGEREHKERSYEAQNDISPIGKDANYPFTFNAPQRADLSPQRYDEMSPFNPDGRPDETAHSTIPRQQPQKHGLRLFRGSFDTITREHLSALVDSIAIEDSPSPTRPGRQYSPDEGQRSGSERSRRSGSDDLPSEQDSRSSKRMRMSPVSPARQAPGVRDWGAQGRAMMERIRAMDDSTTSASRSQSDGQVEERDLEGSGEEEVPPSPPYDYRQPLPYEYKQPVAFSQPDRPTHRSNPSTTSSGYLRRAEELMARIREMSTTDESSSSPSQTAARTVDSRVPSNVSSDWGMAAARGARQFSDDQQPGPSRRAGLEERRPTSAASSNGQADGQPAGGVNLDDLNRFVSATTVATSTTISTSFVKHAGPRGNGAAAIRVIKPDEVAGVVSDRVGRMRYDKAQMRWVKERDEGLGTVEELAEGSGTASAAGGSRNARSRSEESEDVFAGMDSWGRESRVSGRSGSRPISQEREQDGGDGPAGQAEQAGEDDMDVETESQSSVEDGDDDDGQGVPEADRTHIMRGSDSDSSDSDGDDGVPFDPTQPGREALTTADQERKSPRSPRSPARPPIHHANSAPPVMTPLPGHLSLPRPIRSALRGANSATPAISKKTSWLDHVTPGPGASGERRSVSFSDGKKSGRMRDLHSDMTNESDGTGVFDAGLKEAEGSRRGKAVEVDGEWFRAGTAPGDGERSWMPSARTKRIEGMFDQMGDLSLDAATPSKPPARACDSLVTSPEALNSAVDPDKTIRPSYSPERVADRSSRSFRGMSSRRQDPNATYLTECSFGVAHDKLVQVITDVYGSEPYWEDLREIDLSGKGVESVVKMKEFLPRVEDVRLTDNKVSYLTGMPDTLRTLYVARNRLGSLSSFDHLRGLEVLDLTGNLLESVSHLACLTRLRQLTLDENNVKSLEGVLQFSGLTHLRARGNKISVIDLTASSLPSLTILDLGDNRISRLSGLESLSALKELVLDGNRLTSLACKRPLMSLRTIKASDNELSSIDLASFPKIRTLYADRNRLSGLARSDGSRARLENVSLRNQEAGEMRLDWNALSSVKRLYLSGNPLSPSFFPSRPLDSLIYLELAACSLSTWPDLRSIAPKLEILNVNYNFLSTLDGVRGLYRLRKLSCVGAKLGDGSKGIMSGLKGLSALEEVDLRMNPSTLGFYLPLFLPSPSSSPDLSNAHETSHRAGNPLPNVTLATVRPPDTPGPKDFATSSRRNAAKFSSAPTEVEWKILDSQFRKSLPDEWYSKRLVYRGLIMRSCGALGLLDGVRVEEGERRKAGRLLSAAGEV